MTISLCYVVHNDLPMLRATLPYERRWSDQTVILDMASTDGTQEYCKAFLLPGDVYERRNTNTVPEKGYSEARNYCASLAAGDWAVHNSANTLFDWAVAPKTVRDSILSSSFDVMQAMTRHIDFQGRNPWQLELASTEAYARQSNRWVHKRVPGVEYRGYMHEELYVGDRNAYDLCGSLPFDRLHFHASGNNELRHWRNCWMLLNAVNHPELQRHVNVWWYEVYCKENIEGLKAGAKCYEEHIAKAADKG